jgi:hypothetical protein
MINSTTATHRPTTVHHRAVFVDVGWRVAFAPANARCSATACDVCDACSVSMCRRSARIWALARAKEWTSVVRSPSWKGWSGDVDVGRGGGESYNGRGVAAGGGAGAMAVTDAGVGGPGSAGMQS